MISVTLSESRNVKNGVEYRYWQANWYDGDGKHRAKTIGRANGKKAISGREARKLCNALAGELIHKPRKGTNNWRLGDWLRSYLDGAGYADSSVEEVNATNALLLAYFGADKKLGSITHRNATEFREKLGDPYAIGVKKRQGGGRARGEQTIRKHMRLCKAIFAAAVRDKIIDENPFEGQKSTVLDVDKDWAEIGDAEMARILDACPTQSWRTLFALCRWGCVRQSNAIELEWRHVDTVNFETFTVLHIGAKTTKRRTRIMPIMPKLKVELVKAWEDAPEGATMVVELPREDQRRIEDRAHQIIQAAHVPDYEKPLHTLRKCGTTDLIDMGFSPAQVSEWTGNSIKVLMAHYYRANAARAAASMMRTHTAATEPQKETVNEPAE